MKAKEGQLTPSKGKTILRRRYEFMELREVAMFCLFYSGVVMYTLWLTVARKPERVRSSRK
jgi:hypothetical protein